MCLGIFLGILGAGGSTMLGGREDEASDTEDRSRKEVDKGGAGKLISASLDAVRRRRWVWSGLLVLSGGTPMTPLSRREMSSISLLVSLLATFTRTSFSPML